MLKLRVIIFACCILYVMARKTFEKPGTCPDLPPGAGGNCGDDDEDEWCRGDNSCPQSQKCCPDRCGRSCQDPVLTTTTTTTATPTTTTAPMPRPKDGECPVVIPGSICVEACVDDADCPGMEKCCSHGCGHTCQIPVCKDIWIWYADGSINCSALENNLLGWNLHRNPDKFCNGDHSSLTDCCETCNRLREAGIIN